MATAFVDTSCLVALALGEPSAKDVAALLNRFSRRLASNLLEAELRAAFARERVAFEPSLLEGISWVSPHRPLSVEFDRILRMGTLRGADLWHVACALFLAPDPGSLVFLTLDRRQKAVAAALGFGTS
jgi:predicted nucleic acid-binding protein